MSTSSTTPAQCGTWPFSRSQFPVTLHASPAPPPPPPIHPQILWLRLLPSLPSPPARSPLPLKSFLPYSFPDCSLYSLPTVRPQPKSAHLSVQTPSAAPCTLQSCYPTRPPSVLLSHTLLQVPRPRGSQHARSIPQGLALLAHFLWVSPKRHPLGGAFPDHLLQDHLPGVPTPLTLIVCFFWQHELQAGRGLLSCSPLSPAMQTLSIEQQGQEVSAPKLLGSPSAFSFAPADIFNKK